MAQCLQQSNFDGKCNYSRGGEDIDTENFAMDADGGCWCSDDPRPGDSCDSFQTQWGDDYCDVCGEQKMDCDCGEDWGEYCPDCEQPIDDCDC